MNWLWAGMILLGIIWGIFHGTLAAVTEGMIQSAKDAVTSVSYTHLDWD